MNIVLLITSWFVGIWALMVTMYAAGLTRDYNALKQDKDRLISDLTESNRAMVRLRWNGRLKKESRWN